MLMEREDGKVLNLANANYFEPVYDGTDEFIAYFPLGERFFIPLNLARHLHVNRTTMLVAGEWETESERTRKNLQTMGTRDVSHT